jgi:hypothetical protein
MCCPSQQRRRSNGNAGISSLPNNNGDSYTTIMLIILLIAVLCLNHPALSIEIRLDNFEDIKAVSGAKVTMTCQVDDIRDPLEECDWYSPDGKKYSGKTSGGSNDRSDRDDRVRLDRDNKDLDDSVKVTIGIETFKFVVV